MKPTYLIKMHHVDQTKKYGSKLLHYRRFFSLDWFFLWNCCVRTLVKNIWETLVNYYISLYPLMHKNDIHVVWLEHILRSLFDKVPYVQFCRKRPIPEKRPNKKILNWILKTREGETQTNAIRKKWCCIKHRAPKTVSRPAEIEREKRAPFWILKTLLKASTIQQKKNKRKNNFRFTIKS